MNRSACAVVIPLLMIASVLIAAKDEGPKGLVALSGGDHVAFVDPVRGVVARHETGPVGWLFPAPGGALFAPDLVHGVTTTFDLRRGTKPSRLEGVTMPHFGVALDRYATVVGDWVMLLSYPERADMSRVEAEISNAWQIEMARDGSVVLVFDWRPDSSEAPRLVAVDLVHRRELYDVPLDPGVTRMSVLHELGIIALTNTSIGEIDLVDPRTATAIDTITTQGKPVDVAGAGEGEILIAVMDEGEGRGNLGIWKLKASKKGLRIKHRATVPVVGSPKGLAVDPSGRYAAVAVDSPAVSVIDLEDRELLRSFELEDVPRDLAWCDPWGLGPSIAKWTDGTGAPEDLGEPEKK